MKYLLDTNACIEYLNNKKSPVAISLAAQSPDDVALCSVVKAELYFGAARCRSPETAFEKVSTFVSGFESFPFDDAAAQTSAVLRAKLAATGTPIGPYDVQIAAIAMARGLTLVTHNSREFARVEGLEWADWEKEA